MIISWMSLAGYRLIKRRKNGLYKRNKLTPDERISLLEGQIIGYRDMTNYLLAAVKKMDDEIAELKGIVKQLDS